MFFLLLKRCSPQSASLLCKLIAYRAYLVPILTYASPVWYVNCGNCLRPEFIQKRARQWIVASVMGGECTLDDTYRHLKRLPLSLSRATWFLVPSSMFTANVISILLISWPWIRKDALESINYSICLLCIISARNRTSGIELRSFSILSIPL